MNNSTVQQSVTAAKLSLIIERGIKRYTTLITVNSSDSTQTKPSRELRQTMKILTYQNLKKKHFRGDIHLKLEMTPEKLIDYQFIQRVSEFDSEISS